uniref:DB domain-containing protein n=1 Tax=Rhabditophanes sp. KR3021 TaxID=114890 RepID=A0AC35TT83_9BILA
MFLLYVALFASAVTICDFAPGNEFHKAASNIFHVMGEANIVRKCQCSEVNACKESAFLDNKEGCTDECIHFLQYLHSDQTELKRCFGESTTPMASFQSEYNCDAYDYCTKSGQPTIYIPLYNLTHYHLNMPLKPKGQEVTKFKIHQNYFNKFSQCVNRCFKRNAVTCFKGKRCGVELNEFNKSTAKQIEYCSCMNPVANLFLTNICHCLNDNLQITQLSDICPKL